MTVFLMIPPIPQFHGALDFVVLVSPQHIYLYICMHTCGFHCWLFRAPAGPERTYSHTTTMDKGTQRFSVWSLGSEACTDALVPPVSHRKTVVKWVGMNQAPGPHPAWRPTQPACTRPQSSSPLPPSLPTPALPLITSSYGSCPCRQWRQL